MTTNEPTTHVLPDLDISGLTEEVDTEEQSEEQAREQNYSPRRSDLYRVNRVQGLLDKPKSFAGTGTTRYSDFRTWSRKLKGYLSTINVHYERLMNMAEASTTVITSANYTNTSSLTREDMMLLSNDLRMVLLSYTTANAALRIDNWLERTNDGFELWRRLTLEYRETTRDLARRLLSEIMNYAFDNNNFEDSLASWEALIARYETTTGKAVDEDTIVSTLYNATSGPLHDHLTLHIDNYTTYQAIRQKILDWFRLMNIKSSNTVNAYYPGSSKGQHYGNNNYNNNYHNSNYYQQRRGKGKGSHYHQQGSNYHSNNYYQQGKGKGRGSNYYQKGRGKSKGKPKGKGKTTKGKGRGKGKKGKNYNYMQKGRGKPINYNNHYRGKGRSMQVPHNNSTIVPMDIGAVVDYADEQYYDEEYDDEHYGEDDGWWSHDYDEGHYDADYSATVGAVTTDWDDYWDQDDWWYEDDYGQSWDDSQYYQPDGSTSANTGDSSTGTTNVQQAPTPDPTTVNAVTTASGAASASNTTPAPAPTNQRPLRHYSHWPGPKSTINWGCNIMCGLPPWFNTSSPTGVKSHSLEDYTIPLRDSDKATNVTMIHSLDDCTTTVDNVQSTNGDTVNSALEETREGLLSDSGAAQPTCPKDYATQFETRDDPETMAELRRLNLRVAEGTPLQVFGKRKVDYMGVYRGKTYRFSVDYVVTNTVFPIVCETMLLRENGLRLCADETTREISSRENDFELPLKAHGNLWWIMPQFFDTTAATGAPTCHYVNPVLPGAKSTTTDMWEIQFDELVRVHYEPRRYLFNPSHCGELPEGVHLGLLAAGRTTHVTYATDDSRETINDTWSVNERRRKLQSLWTGETRFKICLPEADTTDDVPKDTTITTGNTTTVPAPPGLELVREENDSEAGDYWVILEDELVRVHTRPRSRYFRPSNIGGMIPLPNAWLGSTRTIRGNYEGTGSVLFEVDDWRSDPLLKNVKEKETTIKWTGTTTFSIDGEKKLAREGLEDFHVQIDYYERSGPTWKRHHNQPRTRLFVPVPTTYGPEVESLRPVRRTLVNYDDGTYAEILDNYQSVGTKPLAKKWTGMTILQIEGDYQPDGTATFALKPKQYKKPDEPSAEELRIHNLTHLPYRTWCVFCVLGRGRSLHARKRKSHRPVIQLDYCFSPIDGTRLSLKMLTVVDVETLMGLAVCVSKKGLCQVALRGTESFLLESGRTGAVLQSDNEPAIQELCAELVRRNPGLSRRHAPSYSSKSMGSIGNYQVQLYGLVRTMRLCLEERLGHVFRLTHKVFPWIVNYCSFLLSRYLIHSDGKTSYHRRWQKNYSGSLVQFGEMVLYLLTKHDRHEKLGSKFESGVYVGKCTETNENMITTKSGQVIRVRTIKRLPPSKSTTDVKSYLDKLFQSPHEAGTKQSTKKPEKDTVDKREIVPLPPHSRLPDELPPEDDGQHNVPTMDAGTMEGAPLDDSTMDNMNDDDTTDDDDDDDAMELEGPDYSGTAPAGSSTTTVNVRPRTDNVDDLPATSRRRIAAIVPSVGNYVCNLMLPEKKTANYIFAACDIPVYTNEVAEELVCETFDDDDEICDYEEQITKREAVEADTTEIRSIQDFGVYIEVEDYGQPREQTRFVRKRKSPTKVKSRLVVTQLKAKTQHLYDRDELFASTPAFMAMLVLLTIGLALQLSIFTCDVSTAFLHAELPEGEETFVQPPEPYYKPGFLWKLVKALYGLRAAPKAWQLHFAKIATEKLEMTRSKYDANVYYGFGVYLLVHVDDLLILGPLDKARRVIKLLSEHLLLKETGDLNSEGATIVFLGRTLRRAGDAVLFLVEESYYSKMFDDGGVGPTRSATTPGTKPKDVAEEADLLSTEDHSLYRRIVGRLQWITPLRPDIAFSTKELARRLTAPTTADLQAARQVLRYLVGTTHYVFALRPNARYDTLPKSLEVIAYSDSDWAGCRLTRRSTTGVCLKLLGAVILFCSRTQETTALSSGEAELYAVGTATAEALFVANLLREIGVCETTSVTCFTDSTAGKSLAARFGTSRRTRHIDTRYLYMQELVTRGLLRLKKVLGVENCADLGTKYLSAADIAKFLAEVGLEENALRA